MDQKHCFGRAPITCDGAYGSIGSGPAEIAGIAGATGRDPRCLAEPFW
jgi:hypothetical protein